MENKEITRLKKENEKLKQEILNLYREKKNDCLEARQEGYDEGYEDGKNE